MRERLEFYPPIPECLQDFEDEGFVAVEGDIVYFRDPLYGEILQPGELPRSITEDEIFRVGVSALQRVTQGGIDLKIAYNMHSGAIDFGELQATAPRLAQCRVVGLEWGSAYGSEYPQHAGEIQFDAMTNKGNGAYCQLAKQWLDAAGVQVVPSDINTHMTAGESVQFRPSKDALRRRLCQMLSHASKVDRIDKEDRPGRLTVEDWTEHGLAWSNYQYFRQYLLLGHFGFMIENYEDQLQPGDTIGLVIGSGHRIGIPQKAEQLGIATQPIDIQLPAENALRKVMFERAMPKGKVSIGELRELASHQFQTNGW